MADLIERDYLIRKFEDTGPPAVSEMGKGFDLGIAAALRVVKSAPAVNRWIPVEDALPEDRQRVLICSKSKRLFDVVFRANAKMPSFNTKIFGKVYAWYCEDVIKWMPMPDAYEP